MVNIGGLFEKAKQAMQSNPDKVRDGLDKVEDLIDKKTGGQYKDKITQGADALEDALGLPDTNDPNAGK